MIRVAGASISWGVCEVPDWGYGLAAVGGFVPVLLHDSTIDPAHAIAAALDTLVAANAATIVLAAATGPEGYDSRPGGIDPAALANEVPERIAHVHLKDVGAAWASRVRAGEVGYTDAVRQGMYRPLGGGDVDIPTIVAALDRVGYDGWYVMEQDTVLAEEPGARASLDYLHKVAS